MWHHVHMQKFWILKFHIGAAYHMVWGAQEIRPGWWQTHCAGLYGPLPQNEQVIAFWAGKLQLWLKHLEGNLLKKMVEKQTGKPVRRLSCQRHWCGWCYIRLLRWQEMVWIYIHGKGHKVTLMHQIRIENTGIKDDSKIRGRNWWDSAALSWDGKD